MTTENKSLSGIITALITPMAHGRIDARSFQNFIDWQVAEGIHGIAPAGTTGEGATLEDGEMKRVYKLAVEAAAGRVPVVAGCGSNSTRRAIRLTRAAESAGADVALHVAPYYNKPTQEGLYKHFKAIHDATEIPILLYNVPGRTIVEISPETQARLSRLPRIIGIKDATGQLPRVAATASSCGTAFRQLSGDDATTLGFLEQGGHGAISVTSNIAPRLCANLFNAHAAGDMETARALDARLQPLHAAMFCETSPGPAKYAASLMDLCRDELRLPLVPMTHPARKAQVRNALAGVGILLPSVPAVA